MRLNPKLWLACALTVILLSACGASEGVLTPTMDTTLIYTEAAQTVAAQFTQTSSALITAAAPTQTNTPEATSTQAPTFTAVSTISIFTLPPGTSRPPTLSTPTFSIIPGQATPTGQLCNDSGYVRDVGTPDNTILKPGQAFDKGWLILNNGTCDWGLGYHLVRVGGNTEFGGDTFVIRFANQIVLAGTITEISLHLVAPKQPGKYEARYQMYSNQDIPFGTGMTVAVEVQK